MINLAFVFFFIPAFMVIYALFKPKYRCKIIILAALLLASWFDYHAVFPMLISSLSGYLFGVLISNSKNNKKAATIFLSLEIIINGFIFLIYSFSNCRSDIFMIKTYLVFGSAVYTLHSISYCLDIYQKKYRCEHDFWIVAEYILFFPVLSAGPLLRYNEVKDTLKSPVITSENLSEGIKLFLLGSSEKLILANSTYKIWTSIKDIDYNDLSVVTAWIGILCFAFYFYYEFLGFSQMGRGLALMLGFNIEHNFETPIKSSGFSDLFSRFNKSLCKWINDYIIKPNLNSKIKISFLVLIIPAAWYGLNFNTLAFGIYFALMVLIEKLLENKTASISIILKKFIFFIMLFIALPILAFDNYEGCIHFYSAFFGISKKFVDINCLHYLKISVKTIILCFICSTDINVYLRKKIDEINNSILKIATPLWVIIFTLLSTSFLASESPDMLRLIFNKGW